MYFCSLFAILGTEIDMLSVRIGDAVINRHHIGSEAGSPASECYGLRGNEFTDAGRVAQVMGNGRQRADFWPTRKLRNLPGLYPGTTTGSKQ